MTLPPDKRRVFVFGLDGASISLVKKWIAEGRLPVLGRLAKSGVFGYLETVPNENSPPAWTSFTTGKNPGKHDIYYFYEKIKGSYGVRFVTGADCKSEPVWTLLGKAGKKVIVINVPMTYPAREVNGILIAGMDAPGPVSEGFTYPKSMAKELMEAVPDYVIEPGITTFVSNRRYDAALNVATRSIDARGRATRYLMKKYPWDFFMVVFREADVVQHHFWKFMDQGRTPDAEEGGKYADAILDVYRRLDTEVGKIIDELPDDCYHVVLSDHGFGAAEGGPPYLNHLLNHAGLLEFRAEDAGNARVLARIKRLVLGGAMSVVQRYSNRRTKEALLRLFPRMRDRMETQRLFNNIHWPKTKVYGEQSRIELWVNLVGRDPSGTVNPGPEYERVCEDVKKILHQWHDPATRKKVVKGVFTKEELYHGPYADKAADIVVKFNDDVRVRGILLIDDEGNERKIVVPDALADFLPVNGAHRDNGTFMIHGSGLKEGFEYDRAQITDLAPTILYLLGQDVPADMDGSVLLDAFKDSFTRGNPVRIGDRVDTHADDSKGNGGYNEIDKKKIEERLKGLGYL